MNYLYYLANASLTLRVIEYLYGNPSVPLDFVTVIHHIDGWIVRIKLKRPLMPQRDGDLRAFLNEVGFPYQPSPRIEMALLNLQSGQSPLKVMRQFQIAIVSHGYPEQHEIEVFRKNFIEGLGYCPEHLA
ncbi:MAG: hypothetical protein ACFB8W_13885 [Elainellaceae cyanobacterium]